MFECVLMEKEIEEMKQCSARERRGGRACVSHLRQLETQAWENTEHLEMAWCAWKQKTYTPMCGLYLGIRMVPPKQTHTHS